MSNEQTEDNRPKRPGWYWARFPESNQWQFICCVTGSSPYLQMALVRINDSDNVPMLDKSQTMASKLIFSWSPIETEYIRPEEITPLEAQI